MNSKRSKSLVVVPSILAVVVLLVGGGVLGLGFLSAHATSASTLDNVQITVQTSGNAANLTLYDLTVYNSTGYPVVTASSNYPGFGAQLPGGKYLFTVLATQQYYYPVVSPGVAATGNASGVASPPASIVPIPQGPPYQYGFSEMTISGPTSLTISTASLDNMPTTSVNVHVSYANGTAAPGAYVDASLIGGSYYGYANNWNASGQTGSDGSFTMQVPSLPFEINAYADVTVNVPQSVVTYTTTIAGESVNITAYYNPDVSLSGDQILIPPQSSVSITLHVEQTTNYVVPYGTLSSTPVESGSPVAQSVATVTEYAGTTGASAQNQASGSQPQVISPLVGSDPTTVTTTSTVTNQSSSSALSEALSIAVILAVVLSAISVALVIRRKPKA